MSETISSTSKHLASAGYELVDVGWHEKDGSIYGFHFSYRPISGMVFLEACHKCEHEGKGRTVDRIRTQDPEAAKLFINSWNFKGTTP